MKRLTDEELAIIEAAAVQLSRNFEEDETNIFLANDLWNIFGRHNTPERNKREEEILRKKYPQLAK